MPSSPTSPGKATKRASPEKMDSSALTTSTWMVFISDLLGFFERFVDGANHVKRLFRQMIAFARHNHLEAANGFRQADVLAGRTGEHLSHVERLRQEALDLAGTGHSQLVFRRQLVHAENGND